MIVDGFDLNSPLVCEGIIGDGCGGGRIFYIADENLYVYDPYVRDSILLHKGLKDAQLLEKKGCVLSVKLPSKIWRLDLSSLT